MSAPEPALPDPATSHAVLIGVSRYTRLHALPAVRNNLTSMAELLTDPRVWGLPAAHCHLVIDPATVDDVLTPIHEAARATSGALVIYYAGHGLRGEAGDLRLALVDGDLDHMHRAVRFDDIREQLLSPLSRGAGKVVILDCCYSGAAMMGPDDVIDDVADKTTIEGTYVMTATTDRRRALAPEGAKHTVFTGALLDVLRNGIPDGPRVLTMEMLFARVVRTLGPAGRPVPQQRSRGDGHRIAIARNRFVAPTSPVDDQPPQTRKRRRWLPAAAFLAVTATVATAALLQPWRQNGKPGPTPSPSVATSGAVRSARLAGLAGGLRGGAADGRVAAAKDLGELARSAPGERDAACAELRDLVFHLLPFPRVKPWYDPKMPALSYRAPEAQEALDQLGSVPCPAVDLEERDLRRARLAGDFRASNLAYSSFYRSDLRNAQFDGGLLTAAHLQEANATQASFVNVNLDGAEIADTILVRADLRGASFKVLPDRRTKFYRADLSGADLRGAHLEGADLHSARFDSATRLEGATADGETLWPPKFDWRKAGVRG